MPFLDLLAGDDHLQREGEVDLEARREGVEPVCFKSQNGDFRTPPRGFDGTCRGAWAVSAALQGAYASSGPSARPHGACRQLSRRG